MTSSRSDSNLPSYLGTRISSLVIAVIPEAPEITGKNFPEKFRKSSTVKQ